MQEAIATGKTVEEATQNALEQLGVSMEDAYVEVLEMPQRKLFRNIPAKVRVTVEEDIKEVLKPQQEPAEESEPVTLQKDEPCAEPTDTQFHREESLLASESLKNKQEDDSQEIPVSLHDYPSVQPAVEYLQNIFEQMGIENFEIYGVKQEETLILKVNGENAGALIGYRGEVMESLSYLCSLVVNRAEGEYIKVGLDINNYRKKREANLIALAKRLAEKVQRTGRSHTLEPMNPYERRIIHAAVSEAENVKSESVGEGTARRVVILPAEMDLSQVLRRNSYHMNSNRNNRSTNRKQSGHSHYRKNQEKRDFGRSYQGTEKYTKDKHSSQRTENINDGENLPLFGKVEL